MYLTMNLAWSLEDFGLMCFAQKHELCTLKKLWSHCIYTFFLKLKLLSIFNLIFMPPSASNQIIREIVTCNRPEDI